MLQSVISPRRTARRTASVRLAAPSLPEIDETWNLTVWSLMPSRAGDRLVRQPFGEQLQHLDLARRQRLLEPAVVVLVDGGDGACGGLRHDNRVDADVGRARGRERRELARDLDRAVQLRSQPRAIRR